VPVEEILEDEIMNVLSQFYSGEFYQRWMESAEEHAKEIEEELRKMFDC